MTTPEQYQPDLTAICDLLDRATPAQLRQLAAAIGTMKPDWRLN